MLLKTLSLLRREWFSSGTPCSKRRPSITFTVFNAGQNCWCAWSDYQFTVDRFPYMKYLQVFLVLLKSTTVYGSIKWASTCSTRHYPLGSGIGRYASVPHWPIYLAIFCLLRRCQPVCVCVCIKASTTEVRQRYTDNKMIGGHMWHLLLLPAQFGWLLFLYTLLGCVKSS